MWENVFNESPGKPPLWPLFPLQFPQDAASSKAVTAAWSGEAGSRHGEWILVTVC